MESVSLRVIRQGSEIDSPPPPFFSRRFIFVLSVGDFILYTMRPTGLSSVPFFTFSADISPPIHTFNRFMD